MVLELAGLNVQLVLLLLCRLAEIAENLLGNILYMLAPFPCLDAVYKGNVEIVGSALILRIELTSEDGPDLPPRPPVFIGNLGRPGPCGILEEELDVLVKGVGDKGSAIPGHLDCGADEGCEFEDPGLEDGRHVGRKGSVGSKRPDKPRRVRLALDANVALEAGGLAHTGLFADRHVGAPRLDVALSRGGVLGVDGKPVAKDVGELGSVAILPADNLLFVLVVVARGQELSENQFGNVAALRGMKLDGNAVAVVFDPKGSVCDGKVHVFNGLAALGRRGPDKGVSRIDENLVKELVEAGVHLDRLPDHLVTGGIVDPSLNRARGRGSNVGVGELEDVLLVAQEFVGFKRLGGGCHGACWPRGGASLGSIFEDGIISALPIGIPCLSTWRPSM